MAEGRTRRRLAAILAADAVGYSRLVRADEEGTIARLKALRQDLIDPKLSEYDGRTVKLMGDGMLVEFASVVDAVRAAVDIQRALAEHNAGLPEDRRIAFRIGVNLGDVVIDGDDIHGDGVNVAARLEALAEPGGICISGAVYDQVRDRLDLRFEDLGDREVKNIDRPVSVWRWVKDAARAPAPLASPEEPLQLPEKPSIAVLPFTNMSGDPEQEYFADGITEDIITVLSQISGLFVIARNSSFTYKGRAVDVKQVAHELGVRYVLEGSVRRAGNRVRITAQLIDAGDGHHLWAERYDRQVDDVFAVQDDITRKMATALQVKLTWGETSHVWQTGTRDFEAWRCMMQAFEHWYRFSAVDNAETRRLCEQAVSVDPDYGAAWALLAWTFWFEARFLHAPNPDDLIERFERLTDKVLALGNAPAQAHHLEGAVHMLRGELDLAVEALTRAIELAPSNAELHGLLGTAFNFLGKPGEGVAHANTAIRLSPRAPEFVLWVLAEGLRWSGALDQALAVAKRCVAQAPDSYIAHVKLTSILIDLDRKGEAMEAAKKVLALDPKFSVEVYGRTQNYTDPDRLAHVLDGLRKAGLPG
jgi:adenylate cyclase